MTLVRNLLQRLNGNKLIILFLLALTGCSSGKKVSNASTDLEQIPSDTSQIIIDSTLVAIDTLADSTLITYKKDTYNIALILPLYLDSLHRDTVEDDASVFPKSVMGLEFYQGVRLALDSLENIGLKANIHLFDSKNDEATVEALTRDTLMKHMDLIIGPVYNNNLRIMADFARHEHIYMVSPLSPADNITENNPYFIMVNPPIDVHCKRIFDYVMAHHRDDHLVLTAQPTNIEWRYAKLFQKYLFDYQEETKNDVNFLEAIYSPQWDDAYNNRESDEFVTYLDSFKTNVIIVASVDRAFIHNISRKLNSLLEYDFDITVFGLPGWGDDASLRLDYIDKLNVHFTNSYWIDKEFYQKENGFLKEYLDTFKTDPSEFVIKGYDIMLYFGNFLKKHGTNFGEMLPFERASAIHTDFHFGPQLIEDINVVATTDTSNKTSDSLKINYIENKYVHLLKYKGYSIHEVN